MHRLTALLCPIILVCGAASSMFWGTAPWSTARAEDGVVPLAAPTTIEQKGIRIGFEITPAAAPDREDPIREGGYADVRFRVSDSTSGAPVPALQPAVWISRRGGMDDGLSCREQIAGHLQGLLSLQADIDLNKYFLLVMNNDQTISVIDPLLGVNGITQLYAMIMLKDRGEDWAFSSDRQRLFVTIPRADAVAVVDLDDLRVEQTLEAGGNPVRVRLQPDGRRLWVGNDSREPEGSGVTVIDAHSLEPVGRVSLGAGHHEIAFSDDSLFAFVTSSIAGTVTVIDTQTLTVRRELATAPNPVAVDYSPLGRRAYVASQRGGITVVDGIGHDIVGRIDTQPGLVALRFAPGGRWGFVANLEQDRVDVLDAASGTVAHRLGVGDQPHQFAFTDSYAYVRHLGTPEVTLIPLGQLGGPAEPGLKQIPLGDGAPGDYPFPALADAISPTGEWTAVVSANPADRMVYYYMEGMIAPMGSYSAYGRVPRAVGILDRSLREFEKGVYGARIRVPRAGDYRVAFLLDSPAVHHCFGFSAAEDPALAIGRDEAPSLSFEHGAEPVAAGEPVTLRFRLTGGRQGASALEDVIVLATRAPFHWQVRQRARPLGDSRYEVELTPDEPGLYLVSVAAASLGLDFTDLPSASLRAAPAAAADQR
jgi:DNA-binding beta-propeller fold protein YncE